jgi:hypothetical protein
LPSDDANTYAQIAGLGDAQLEFDRAAELRQLGARVHVAATNVVPALLERRGDLIIRQRTERARHRHVVAVLLDDRRLGRSSGRRRRGRRRRFARASSDENDNSCEKSAAHQNAGLNA